MDFKREHFDFMALSISTFMCSLFNFIFSVYSKHYVSPYLYGIYSTCAIILTILNYAQLGVLNSYNRDYPQLLGEGNVNKISRLRNTTFSFLLSIYSIILIVSTIIILIIFRKEGFNYYSLGYILNVLISLVANIAYFEIYSTRIQGKYYYSSIVDLLRTFLGVLLGVILVKIIGYWGLFVPSYLSTILAI